MSENLSSFLGNAESIPKRVMPIFFLIDTSGSMEGKKIGAVNSAIEDLELNDKLSKNGFMDRGAASSGFYAPVILLLSDGEPTDDYLTALKKLQQNKWYQAALKIAIAIGEDANREVLKKAIRNVELLFTVNDIGSLKKIIRFIAVTSSQIASTSATVSEDSAEAPADVKDVRSTSAEHQMAEAAKVMLEEEKESAYSSIESTEESPEPMILGSDDSDDDDEWD